MNDPDFRRRLKQHLNLSLQGIDPSVTSRLHAARRKAIERQKVSVTGLSLAGAGRMIAEHLIPERRTAIAMLLVILVAVGSAVLGDLQHAADIEEVDSSLLADDLPIDAYLDRGFDTWLQNEALD